jgi:hypothetical protein
LDGAVILSGFDAVVAESDLSVMVVVHVDCAVCHNLNAGCRFSLHYNVSRFSLLGKKQIRRRNAMVHSSKAISLQDQHSPQDFATQIGRFRLTRHRALAETIDGLYQSTLSGAPRLRHPFGSSASLVSGAKGTRQRKRP